MLLLTSFNRWAFSQILYINFTTEYKINFVGTLANFEIELIRFTENIRKLTFSSVFRCIRDEFNSLKFQGKSTHNPLFIYL